MVHLRRNFGVVVAMSVMILQGVLKAPCICSTYGCCGQKKTIDSDIELEHQTEAMLRGSIPTNTNGEPKTDIKVHSTTTGNGNSVSRGWTLKRVGIRLCILFVLIAFIVSLIGVPIVLSTRNKYLKKNNSSSNFTTVMPRTTIDHREILTNALNTRLDTITGTAPLTESDKDEVDITEKAYKSPTVLANVSPEKETLTTVMTTELLSHESFNSTCKETGLKVYKILDEISPNSNIDNYEIPENQPAMLNDIEEDLQDIETIECGKNFFHIEENNDAATTVRFSEKNVVVKHVIDTFKCTKSANEVIAILITGDYYSRNETVATPIYFTPQNGQAVINGVNIAAERNCEFGFFEISKGDSDFILKYKNSNPYIYNAWKPKRDELACTASATTVVAILDEIYYYKRYVDVSYVIENSADKTQELIDGATISDDCDCGNGFFSLQKNEENVELQYKNANQYIAAAWGEVRSEINCGRCADDVITVLADMGLFSQFSKVTHTIPSTDNHMEVLKEKLDIAKYSSCGDNFFTLDEDEEPFTLSYSTKNSYISEFFSRVPTDTVCSKTADGIVLQLKELGYSLDAASVNTNITDKSARKEIWRLHDNALGWSCGSDYFYVQHGTTYTTVTYSDENRYVAEALNRAKGE